MSPQSGAPPSKGVIVGSWKSLPNAVGNTWSQNGGSVASVISTASGKPTLPPVGSSSSVKAISVKTRLSPKLSRQGATPSGGSSGKAASRAENEPGGRAGPGAS